MPKYQPALPKTSLTLSKYAFITTMNRAAGYRSGRKNSGFVGEIASNKIRNSKIRNSKIRSKS